MTTPLRGREGKKKERRKINHRWITITECPANYLRREKEITKHSIFWPPTPWTRWQEQASAGWPWRGFFRAGTLCKGLDSNVYVPNGRLNSSLVRHSFDERVSAQMQRLLSLRRVSVCEMHIVWGFYSSAKVVPLNLNLSCFIWSEKKEKKADGKRRPETEEISITCTGSEAKPRQRASSCQEEYLPWPQWRTTTKRGWTTEAQGNSKGRPNLLEFPYHEETFAEFHQCFLRHLG